MTLIPPYLIRLESVVYVRLHARQAQRFVAKWPYLTLLITTDPRLRGIHAPFLGTVPYAPPPHSRPTLCLRLLEYLGSFFLSSGFLVWDPGIWSGTETLGKIVGIKLSPIIKFG